MQFMKHAWGMTTQRSVLMCNHFAHVFRFGRITIRFPSDDGLDFRNEPKIELVCSYSSAHSDCLTWMACTDWHSTTHSKRSAIAE